MSQIDPRYLAEVDEMLEREWREHVRKSSTAFVLTLAAITLIAVVFTVCQIVEVMQ